MNATERSIAKAQCDKAISVLWPILAAKDAEIARLLKDYCARDAVRWFAVRMELVLQQNDHKGGWAGIPREDLLKRIIDEWQELVRAKTPDEVIKEACDVANFAMMVADNARREKAQAQP